MAHSCGLNCVARRALSFIYPTYRGRRVVELVVIACLLKDPHHCEAFHLPFAAEMQVPQCVWQSQIQVAQWAGEHPIWVVKKVTCEPPAT